MRFGLAAQNSQDDEMTTSICSDDSGNDARLPEVMMDRCGVTVEAVEALLDAGADVNGVNSVGHTALIRAFWQTDPLPFVKLLLSRGADVNVRSGDGRTALHMAAEGSPEAVLLLLQHGANFNEQGYGGMTPLHVAVWRNRRDICQLLLDAGADPNLGDPAGHTPVFLAFLYHWPDIVELLCRHGARIGFDPNQVDRYPAAEAAARDALELGYPAILAAFGMGTFIHAVDAELGLPIRLNGDVIPMGGQAAVRGHRAGVVEWQPPATHQRVELGWGPPESHLAFLRFVNLEGTDEPREEDHHVLDVGLGEFLPS
jgi:hypothetical protein